MGLGGLEQPPDRVARARGGIQRTGVGAQARVRLDGLRAGDRQQLAAALVQIELQPEERLQPPAEAAARATHPLGDRAHPSPLGRVQVQDAVGLAVAQRAQHDRLGLDRSGHRSFESRLASGAPFARLPVAHSPLAPARPVWDSARDRANSRAILYEVMSEITVYSTEPCSFCARVKGLLQARACEFTEINLAKDPEGRAELARRTGMMTFPQVVIDGELLGGFTELQAAVESGRLDGRCSRASPTQPSRLCPLGQPRCLTAQLRRGLAGAVAAAGSARTRRCRVRPRPS